MAYMNWVKLFRIFDTGRKQMSEQEKVQLLSQVEVALDDIRPHRAVDGGDVEVVDLTEEYVLRIKWLGNCENCSMSMFTLRAGIEESVRKLVPKINRIEPVNN